MLTDEMLKSARKRAEAAVADMTAGELRTAAFSVILAQLLSGGTPASVDRSRGGASRSVANSEGSTGGRSKKSSSGSSSLSSRLLSLRDDGFFAEQKTLAEIREELKKHGWHYPVTTLSGPMQGLVRNRELRRERVAEGEGKKRVWKYSNS